MSKKNGYLLYAETQRAKLEAEGCDLSAGYPALIHHCSELWNALPDSEKRHYHDQAKRMNERRKQTEVRVSTESTLKKAAFTEVRDPRKFTDEDILSHKRGSAILAEIFEPSKGLFWLDQPIVVCSFSVLVEPGHDLLYLPAEIGLSAFNMTKGVMGNFSRIIDPGPIPQGHGIEAFQTAIGLGLPQMGTVPELADYKSLIQIVERFLQQYKGIWSKDGLFVFAFNSDFLLVKRCFEALFKLANYRIPGFQVLSLDQYTFLGSKMERERKGLSLGGAKMEETPNESQIKPASEAAKDSAGTQSASAQVPVEGPTATNVPDWSKMGFMNSEYRTPGKSLTGVFVYSSVHPYCVNGIFLSESNVDECIKQIHNYKYYEELCCVYHYKCDKEINFCAMNASNRYAFSVLEFLTISNTVKPVIGQHYPEFENPEVEKQRRYEMLAKWTITKLEEEMKQYVPPQLSPEELVSPMDMVTRWRVTREPQEGREGREARYGRGGREARDDRGGREARDGRGGREERDGRGSREERDGRGGREARDERGGR